MITIIIIVQKLNNDKDSFIHEFHIQGAIYMKHVLNSKKWLTFNWSWNVANKKIIVLLVKECQRLSFLLND